LTTSFTQAESSTAADTHYNVNIENKIMHDKRMISAAGDLNYLQAVQIPGGAEMAFASDPDPSKCLLHRYYRDSSSLTGWSHQELPLPGHQYIYHKVAQDIAGTIRVFVITSNTDTPTENTPATVYELPIATDGTPGAIKILSTTTMGSNYASMLFSPIGPTLLWSCANAQNNGRSTLTGLMGQALDTPFTPMVDTQELGVDNAQDSIQEIVDPTGQATWPNITLAILSQGAVCVFHGHQQSGANGAELNGTITTLPPVSSPNVSINCFTVSAFPDGRQMMLCTVGDGIIRSLAGHANPAAPNTVLWDSAWLLVNGDRAKNPIVNPEWNVSSIVKQDGGLSVMWSVQYSEGATSGFYLFMLERGPGTNGVWTDAVRVNAEISHFYTFFRDDQGDPGFCYIGGRDLYLRFALRDAGEDWREETVDTQDGTTFIDVDVYRVGVVVTDAAGAAIIGKSITIAANDEAYFFANGALQYLNAKESFTTTTNQDGALWIMVDIGGSIAVPTFTFTSTDGIFDGNPITVMPEADAQHLVTHVSADELQNAKDDQGNSLLPADTPYADVATSLNQLGDAIAHIYAPTPFSSGRLTVGGRHGVRIAATLDSAQALPLSAGYWSMTRDAQGKIVFANLTPESATLESANLIKQVAASRGMNHDDFFSFFDDFEDMIDSIGDAVVSVGKVIINGVLVTISYIADGVERLVQTALDGVSKVLDVVKAVLDFVGAVIGRVLGWIIRAIGWLLGLPDLRAIKNRIKADIISAVAGLNSILPDPGTQTNQLHTKIEGWEHDLASLVASFKRTPEGTASNQNTFGPLGSVLGAMAIGSTNISSQVTWLMEKLSSALPDLSGSLPTAPDLGINPQVQSLLTQLQAMEGDVASFGTDLVAAGISSWVNSLSAFDSANFDPVLDVLSSHGTALLSDLDGTVSNGLDILHVLWANPTVITDWLDQPIYIPFFSSFYDALVGDDFSILDFVALAAAVPYSLIGPTESTTNESDDPARDRLFYTIVSLMLLSALFASWAAAVQQPAGNPENKETTKLIALVTLAIDIVTNAMCIHLVKNDSNSPKFVSYQIKIAGAVAEMVLIWTISRLSGSPYPYGGIARDLIAFLFNTICIAENDENTPSLKWYGSMVINTAGRAAHLAVDQKWINVEAPNIRAGYTVFQGAAAGTCAYLFYLDNKQE